MWTCGQKCTFGEGFGRAQEFHSSLHPSSGPNARQATADHRGGSGTLDIQPLHAHHINKSRALSAGSDEGVSTPTDPSWAFGGAGIMVDAIQKFSIPDDAQSLAEYAHTSFDDLQLHAYTPIPGPFPSYTRAEIIGIILALCVPYKLDVAVDNLNVVRLLQKMMADREFAPRRPWNLSSN